ncbi:MAG: flagellar basal body rod protein FlgC [Pseudomonadota bacterium]
MNLLDTLQISASGLTSQRVRLQTIASNMANARTTRTEAGGPYQRKLPVFEARQLDAFGDALEQAMSEPIVTEITSDDTPPVRVFDPSHPDADADGYVAYPAINLMEEMVDLMSTSRTFEANTKVVETTRMMANEALAIGR